MEIEPAPIHFIDLNKWSQIGESDEADKLISDEILFEMTKDIVVKDSLNKGEQSPVGHYVYLSGQIEGCATIQYNVPEYSGEELVKVALNNRDFYFKSRSVGKSTEYNAVELRKVNPVLKDHDFVNSAREIPLAFKGRQRIFNSILELYLDKLLQDKDKLVWKFAKKDPNVPASKDSIVILPRPEELLPN